MVVVVYFASFLTNSLMYKLFFKIFDRKVSLVECFDFTLKTSIANILIPFKAGAFVRAVYFKDKYRLSYSKFSAMLGSSYFIAMAVLSLLGLYSLVVIRPDFNNEIGILVVFLLVVLITAVFIIFLRINIKFADFKYIPNFFKKWVDIIDQLISAWNDISRDVWNVGLITILTIFNTIWIVLITKFEFSALGLEIKFAHLLLYSVLSAFTVFFAFTPSALGIKEALIFIFSGTILINSQDILNIAVIDRSVLVLLLLVLFIIMKMQAYKKNNFIRY